MSATPSRSTAARQQFNGSATWNLKADKSTTATVTITNSAGQTVYSGNFALDNKQGQLRLGRQGQ